jgi:hypothetical protein
VQAEQALRKLLAKPNKLVAALCCLAQVALTPRQGPSSEGAGGLVRKGRQPDVVGEAAVEPSLGWQRVGSEDGGDGHVGENPEDVAPKLGEPQLPSEAEPAKEPCQPDDEVLIWDAHYRAFKSWVRAMLEAGPPYAVFNKYHSISASDFLGCWYCTTSGALLPGGPGIPKTSQLACQERRSHMQG